MKDKRSAQAQLEQSALHLAIQLALEQEAAEFEDARSAENLPVKGTPVSESSNRVFHLPFRSAVLLCLLLLALAFGTTLALSHQVHLKIGRFVISNDAGSVKIGFVPSGESIPVPEGWPEDFFPAYIPEGYTLVYSLPHRGGSIALYENNAGEQLSIQVSDSTQSLQLEGVYTVETETEIHGATATLIALPDGNTDIVWCEGNTCFIVSAVNADTACKVAESMVVLLRD